MILNFGSRELCSALINLGFKKEKQGGTRHLKFSISKKLLQGIRPFIIVILNRKNFDPHTRSSYIRQIKKLGFSEKEIIDAFEK